MDINYSKSYFIYTYLLSNYDIIVKKPGEEFDINKGSPAGEKFLEEKTSENAHAFFLNFGEKPHPFHTGKNDFKMDSGRLKTAMSLFLKPTDHSEVGSFKFKKGNEIDCSRCLQFKKEQAHNMVSDLWTTISYKAENANKWKNDVKSFFKVLDGNIASKVKEGKEFQEFAKEFDRLYKELFSDNDYQPFGAGTVNSILKIPCNFYREVKENLVKENLLKKTKKKNLNLCHINQNLYLKN